MVRGVLRQSRRVGTLCRSVIVQDKTVQGVLDEPPTQDATEEQQYYADDRARFADGGRRAQSACDYRVEIEGYELLPAVGAQVLLLLSKVRY